MGKTLSGFAALALCLGWTSGIVAQDFSLGVAGVEDVYEGSAGSPVAFTADLTLTSSGIDGDVGAQGWSLGLANNGIDITDVTWSGTASANAPEGVAVGGFQVAELIDPGRNGGQQGCVSAIVLSFTMPITLTPNATAVVLKASYEGEIPDGSADASLVYQNGLIGSGQPVSNDVTFEGQTIPPDLGTKNIVLRKTPDPENTADACSDGEDNDLDGDIDCDDSDCEGVIEESQAAGNCDDGEDNDCDGIVDMDDRDCQGPTPGFDLVANGPGSTDVNAEFEIVVAVRPSEAGGLANGSQGWSFGMTHEGSKVTGIGNPTITGTRAGALSVGGFEKSEFVNPDNNGGQHGLVSAVVLSFTMPITLDPAAEESVLLARYGATDATKDTVNGGGSESASFEFVNGLRGSGQPVDTVLTVEGATVAPNELIGATVAFLGAPAADVFVRGDANDDGKVNIADPIWTINMLVRSGPQSPCPHAADSNGDGMVDLSDAMYTIEYRFLAGPPPSAPFPGCGEAEPVDGLPTCNSSVCP